jgi:hypothetical protein
LTGIDLNANQIAEPRAFKAHMNWNDIPKGGRYIVSIRNPEDVAVSLFHFLEGHTFERDTISMPEYVRGAFMASNRYWRHLASWWERRNDPSVLLLSFERMVGRIGTVVDTISKFIGFDPDPSLSSIVADRASFEYMRMNHDKFDDRTTTNAVDLYCELPPTDHIGKIRLGPRTIARGRVPDDVRSELQEVWRREIGSRFGLPDYQSLIDAI